MIGFRRTWGRAHLKEDSERTWQAEGAVGINMGAEGVLGNDRGVGEHGGNT